MLSNRLNRNFMHEIEPFFNWQHLYLAEEDELSPFFGEEHSEFTYSNTIYNYYVHPQWDDFGSKTLYLKVLYADYEQQFCIIEFIGEWNDAIENDIMELKSAVIDPMQEAGINKFILIMENALSFHASDDCYYEEWFEDLQETKGWVVFLNVLQHELEEFKEAHIDRYFHFIDYANWRTHHPKHLFDWIQEKLEIKYLE